MALCQIQESQEEGWIMQGITRQMMYQMMRRGLPAVWTGSEKRVDLSQGRQAASPPKQSHPKGVSAQKRATIS
jgi:hypothetical protein